MIQQRARTFRIESTRQTGEGEEYRMDSMGRSSRRNVSGAYIMVNCHETVGNCDKIDGVWWHFGMARTL